MAIVIIVSFVGLIISVYFALVYYGIAKSDSRFIPMFCRMDEDSCQSILKVREARVFGIPNFQLGILFYLGMMVLALSPDALAGIAMVPIVVSGVSVVVSLFLAYSLLFVIKKKCVLCFTAHILNVFLFLLLFP
jgi:uncharacterized membrane protein